MELHDAVVTALHRFEDGAVGAAAFLRELAMGVAEELLCERVGIWTFDMQGEQLALRCLCQYDLRNAFTEGQVLPAGLMAGSFSALAECGVLVASEARSHPATRPLADTYLVPRGIHSMLDVALAANGRWTGILSCERVDTARAWNPRDVAYVRTAAARTSLVIERAWAGRWRDPADTSSVRTACGRDVSIVHRSSGFEPDDFAA